MKILRVGDLMLVLPVALLLGGGFALIEPGASWGGWIGLTCLFTLGIVAMLATWRWAGGGKTLAWMTVLAVVLRLAVGVGIYLVLPIDGYNVPDDKAGFVFTDAHRRDDQAWELASSGKPIWSAFDRSYYTDQYGGLLAGSAIAYRVFSADSHRPLLILALAAIAAALGVPFFFRATQLLWNARLASLSTWLFVLYPEFVLTGGAQMREPFLLTLLALTLFGFARWNENRRHSALVWMAVGFLGMLLVSPAIALVALLLFGVWWVMRGERLRVPWPVALGAGLLVIASVAFLVWSLGGRGTTAEGPVGVLSAWAKASVSWVIYQLEQGSGQVQNVFSKLNPAAQFLFVIGYGITQPVLPPAFFEPTTLTWHIIAILRSSGWYLLLPLLLYAPVAAYKLPPGGGRRVWVWLAFFSWAWIVVCAVRAGGDQWDNPRYRLIFFGVEAIVAAFAWLAWREKPDLWLPRIVAAEVWCVLVLGQWYVARYYLLGIHLPILVVLSLCLCGVLLIVAAGWLWDARLRRRGTAP